MRSHRRRATDERPMDTNGIQVINSANSTRMIMIMITGL